MNTAEQVRASWDALVRSVTRGLAGGDLREHVPLVIVMGAVESARDGASLTVDCADVAVVVHGSVDAASLAVTLRAAAEAVRDPRSVVRLR
jgi:hypothetical protein